MQLRAQAPQGVRGARASSAGRCLKVARPALLRCRDTASLRHADVRVHAAASSNQKVQERWESQVRDGRVRNISTADVKAMQQDGWVVLDVRPPAEMEKAPVSNAVHVPLFVPDPSNDLGSVVKKATDFAMGSWWLGGTHHVPNNNFLPEVQSKIAKDSRVIVACQKGLRSLAACEQLAKAGYQQLAWINGGFDTAKSGDIPTTNDKDVRYAGIGGLSEAIGWTDVQREENKNAGLLGGVEGVIKVMSIILVADLLLFAYEYVNYWRETGTGPFAQ